MSLVKTLQSKSITKNFYGKPITEETALEVTYVLADYYNALLHHKKLPIKPNKDLSFLIRCNAIANLYYTSINSSLKGVQMRNSALTQDQVIYTWLFAYKMETKKPLITLNNTSLIFNTIHNE
ncbi:hypothetical protein M1M27_gp21 [Cellulophaga phage Ingeline_1]|uniref:Uncharacterized protein n=1 Tax=Cellulophaga phage Ingeline_1 TaxID=2745674 RepID=A0A8E5E882_9CAUD|nr:hypothetical protein M1M27_gp21 [Cellulophaga phage Ingeline_1]QQV90018.1 hypothetical protein Ingeline2_30 [Cellulophaga phage Ingeline_2]QQV90068.1 hypothetical protein Ingeline3_30 [Cellulophaga phage Ingeline_3]QQV90118.1 hypothetical protein Ingeline4_30 [Cellulophaga phage Ingeline_4]QQV90217.1 hypothetical protein Ingeline6_30 [Cellulophaga phage Ingeline_6]QQV90267.1 hypothetical protein Ingeline7_30 [Cellulophaga phage Ingeline_7]QQV90314.1 hypothetical protein Ingeline8_21 [Cellu